MVFFLLLVMALQGWEDGFQLPYQSCVPLLVMSLPLTWANWSSAAFLCSGLGSIVARNSSVNFCASIFVQVVVQFAGFCWLSAQTEKLPQSTRNSLELNWIIDTTDKRARPIANYSLIRKTWKKAATATQHRRNLLVRANFGNVSILASILFVTQVSILKFCQISEIQYFL